MRIISAEDLAREAPRPSAVTIGMFDGMHRGHAAVLAELRAHARAREGELGAPLRTMVLTFRMHPKAVTLGNAPASITSLEHRLLLIERAGIEAAVVLDFDERIRSTSAAEFLREWIHRRLGARVLVLGWDSKFGRDQSGNLETIAPLASELGMSVYSVPPLKVRGRAVSSTAIREAITLGDLAGARVMLGRHPGLLGTVVAGDRRGRELGFPTANLELDHQLSPPHGVYVVATSLAGKTHYGVMNLGRRPTVAGAGEAVLCEVHLLDYSGDLYGQRLEVELLESLREERKFAGLDELRAAIASDVERTRAILASRLE